MGLDIWIFSCLSGYFDNFRIRYEDGIGDEENDDDLDIDDSELKEIFYARKNYELFNCVKEIKNKRFHGCSKCGRCCPCNQRKIDFNGLPIKISLEDIKDIKECLNADEYIEDLVREEIKNNRDVVIYCSW